MDALQFILMVAVPVACATAVALYFRERWAWYIFAAACISGFLLVVGTAHATTKIEGGPANVPNHQWCNWFRIHEERYGVLDQKLWELREKVVWCTNASRTKVNYITRSWGHWAVGGTWKFVRATRSGGRATNRSWYTRRVSAVFDGYTPLGLFNEENDPFVWIKVYARPRGHVAWNSGCGC